MNGVGGTGLIRLFSEGGRESNETSGKSDGVAGIAL